MPTVGVLSVGIKGSMAGPGGLQNALSQAGAAVSKFKTALVGMGTALAGSALLRDIAQIAQDIDGLSERAVRMGVDVSRLGGLQMAAERGGMSVEQLETSVVKFTKNLQEAGRGTGAARRALDALGVSAKDLIKMPLDERLGVIADKMAGVADESAQLELALNLFGKSGAGMLNMLGDGSDGLKGFQKEAEKLGAVIGDDAAKQVGRFADAMDRLKSVTQGFKNQIVISIAPAAADFLEGILELQGFMRGELARQGMVGNDAQRSGDAWRAESWGLTSYFPLYSKIWNKVGRTVFQGMAVGEGDRIRPEEITTPRGSLVSRESVKAIESALTEGAQKSLGVNLSKLFDMSTLKTQATSAAQGLQGLMRSAADARDKLQSMMWQDILRTMWGPGKEEPTPKEIRPAVEALERGTAAAAAKIDEIMRAAAPEELQKRQLREAEEQTRLLETFVREIEQGNTLLLADL